MGNNPINNFSNIYHLMNRNAVTQNIICYIHSINNSKIENYLQLSLLLDNEINNQFLINSKFFKHNFKDINDANGTKIKITQFQFINVENNIFIKILEVFFYKNEIIEIEPKDQFIFNSTYIKSFKELKVKNIKLFSILLKNINNEIFEDINGEQIKLYFNNKFDRDSIYYFCNLLYDEKSAKQISVSKVYNYNDKKILSFMNNNIISGEITEVFFYENKIKVKTNNNKNIIIKLNNKLMKKISLNLLCKFVNFNKIEENQYKYNEYSTIFYDDKTILRIEFMDFKEDFKNKYNIIEINSNQYSINANIVEIPISSEDNNNSFVENIIYKNINNRNKADFLIELYKGKVNDFTSYINLIKDGYCYEIQYETKYSSLLPKSQKIIIDKEEVYIDRKVTFGNNYKEKFGIINIPKQVELSKDFKNCNNNEIKSEKILILLNKNKSQKMLNFQLNYNYEKKQEFKMDKDYENKLSEFFNEFKNNYAQFYENKKQIIKKYSKLFKEEKSPFQTDILTNYDIYDDINQSNEFENLLSDEPNYNKNIKKQSKDKVTKKEIKLDDNEINYRKYCEQGFKKYIFKNTEEEYEKIKKLCFLYVLKYFDYSCDRANFNFSLDTYFQLIESSKNLEYIDKIHVLLGFINDKIFDENKRSIIFEYKLINLEEKYNDNSFKYCSKAYDLFFKIIDKLKEDSAFFTCLSQINSLIFYEKTTASKMYSGTMLNINDIKLEIHKNIKRYFFLTKYNGDSYAHFSPFTRMIFYHPLTFLNSKSFYIPEDKIDNAAIAILFLIFHQVCGHYKTNITNLDDAPNQFYDNNYDILKYELGGSNNSGNIFEYFLSSDMINISEFYEKKNIDVLLSENIYLEKSFSNLNSTLKNLGVLGEDNNKFTKKIKSISKNSLRNIPFPDMTKILFRLRINCKDEVEFQKLLNDNPVYKLMLEKVKKRYKTIHYKP